MLLTIFIMKFIPGTLSKKNILKKHTKPIHNDRDFLHPNRSLTNALKSKRKQP